MTITLQTMLALTRLKLNDLSVRVYPEPLLIASANEGKNELAKIIRQAKEDYFQTTATGTIAVQAVPNCSSITLPDDFAELRNLEITDDGYTDIQFVKMSQSDQRWRTAVLDGGNFASGQGTFYYCFRGLTTLLLSPGSDIALNYKLTYNQTVPDMSLPTDYPEGIPDEHNDFIVTWMISEALRSAKDDRLNDYLAKLEYQKNNVVAAVRDRQVKEPEYVAGYMEAEERWG